MPDFLFADTSALSKRYVDETGSTWLRALLQPSTGNKVVLVRTTAVELIAALSRRERGGSLAPADAASARARFRTHLAGVYQVLELTAPLAERAMSLAERHGLRSYDAIQLAAALEANTFRVAQGQPPLLLLSSDTELNTAARVEGLRVEDPNAHP